MTPHLLHPGDWMLKTEPRPVQIEALNRSYFGYATREGREDVPFIEPLPHAGQQARGWGHFLQMRLGKTPLTFAEFMLFRRDYGITKLFILSPNKFKHDWALEAATFGVDFMPVCVFESADKKRVAKFMNTYNGVGMLVMNIEALQHEYGRSIAHAFVDSSTFMAIDESVLIKNDRAISTKTALLLGKEAAVTRALTGQPMPQSVGDLFPQLKFVKALEGQNFFAFRNRFAVMGGWQGKKIVGVKNLQVLRALVRQHAFVARRAVWADPTVPDLQTVEFELSPDQEGYYDEMEEEFLLMLDDDAEVSASHAANKYAKLQQISTGFVYTDEGKPRWLVPFDMTPKFLDLRERLWYMSDKVIIIAYFKETVEALYDALQEFNPAVISSESFMKKRGLHTTSEKARFNTDPACRVMIGQERAIKYGHTCRGNPDDPCLTMVFFENSYSLDDREQAEQRNQGVDVWGQMHILDYVCSDAERRVIRALQDKKALAGLVLDPIRKEGIDSDAEAVL